MNEKIKEIISQYKANFTKIDSEERYKWIAIKHFQDNWDIDSPDFADMLEKSFSKHVNLLDSGVARPLGVLVFFAKREPENVRNLFKVLYDETLPIENRKRNFMEGVELFKEMMYLEDPNWKSTFQDQHSLSVYLTFKYPEHYYIYKYSVLKSVAPLLKMEIELDRILTYSKMCNAIHDVVKEDQELIKLSHDRLDKTCYQDPNNRLLAMDVAFFAYKTQRQIEKENPWDTIPTIALDFKKWLESTNRNEGLPYDPKTVRVYLNQIESEASKLTPRYEGKTNLFVYDDIHKFEPMYVELTKIIKSKEYKINGAFPKALKLYEEFLKVPTGNSNVSIKTEPNLYTKKDFLEEVFLAESDYDSLINQLIRKKNMILQGAPGVGKTFIAKRLVYSLIGSKTSERIRFIQFHQNYGYDDFVMGYRPNDTGFELKEGVFYTFCKEAAKDPEHDWYFIIDEINRGNISKIFGELLMLIESDKRSINYAISLNGKDEPFFVPENVHIIGMMNTADRSIALIDYALRRRFAFFTIEPAFSNESFRDYIENKNSNIFANVVEVIIKLNDDIENDTLLGTGFKIGHSYFCTEEQIDSKLLRDIILYEIKPLLAEYWIDDTDKVSQWTLKLLEAIQ